MTLTSRTVDVEGALELQPLQKQDDDRRLQTYYYYSDDNNKEQRDAAAALDRSKDHLLVAGDKIEATWKDFFLPPDVPVAVQLYHYQNLAIPACYFTVGVLQGMMRPVLNVYPLDLGATEAQQTTLATIATLPSTFKIAYGFLSDNVPVAGYRRKPYMWAGWMLTSLAMAALLHSSDLTLPLDDDDDDKDIETLSEGSNAQPSMEWLMTTFFLAGCGMWLADVMADSIVAQKVTLEPAHSAGSLQSSCYAWRFFGLMMAAPISTYLYKCSNGPASAVFVVMVLPLLILPLVALLSEERNYPIPSTTDQCQEIWRTVCSRAVWQPMGYVYMFNLLQVSNAAWRQYLKTVLHFTATQLNAMLVASYALLYLGTVTYKSFFLHTSWRRLYQACILLNAVFSGLQLALIRGHTLGLSPFLFALGDEAFAEFIIGIQVLPNAILMVSLCPAGSEGVSYALFTTTWNSALLLAPAISSSLLLGIWDVSKETMESGHLDGLFKLSLLTTVIQMSPILFLALLPHGRDDLRALADEGSSKIGGGFFLMIVFASMSYTFIVAILNIVLPGWAGES